MPALTAQASCARFRRALEDVASRGVRITGPRFRATSPRWAASRRLLDGEGARRGGGRWNPPGIPVAYLSDTPEAALTGYPAGLRSAGFAVNGGLPAVIAWGEVDLHRVLDLKQPTVRARLKARPGLALDWRAENEAGREAVSQALGRAAREAGFEGLLVPSAVVHGVMNLVVFVDRIGRSSRVEAHGLLSPDGSGS
ncbi:MAG: RES family NAD+ phosphorylase [Planctomycetes bacterium]|nr:RES family NAD+ phosphorylase [Planctomycetota bacterium]